MSRALITIKGEEDRALGAKWIAKAEPGTRIEFKAMKRTLPQNDRMWAMLTDIAMQLPWHGHKLRPDDWKILFLDALNREVYAVPDLYGIGTVNLGRSSSDLSKDEMAQLMELMAAFGAEHSVKFRDQPELAPPTNGEPKPDRAEILKKARAAKAAKTAQGSPPVHSGGKPVGVLHPAHKPAQEPPQPQNTAEYSEYIQTAIRIAKDQSKLENWFLSEKQAKLRQACKVDDLTARLLHSLIRETPPHEPLDNSAA